jgi:hypothetical protein
MTTLAIRKKLITYLADAEDSKVKALYTLLESEIDESNAFALTKEQIQILDIEPTPGKKLVKLLKANGLFRCTRSLLNPCCRPDASGWPADR